MNEKSEKVFDAWEFAQACARCGIFDNNEKKYPVTVLDVDTKLCEFCFDTGEEV